MSDEFQETTFPREKPPTCKTCRWLNEKRCLRFPPVHNFAWPGVDSGSWCGEHPTHVRWRVQEEERARQEVRNKTPVVIIRGGEVRGTFIEAIDGCPPLPKPPIHIGWMVGTTLHATCGATLTPPTTGKVETATCEACLEKWEPQPEPSRTVGRKPRARPPQPPPSPVVEKFKYDGNWWNCTQCGKRRDMADWEFDCDFCGWKEAK